jgi:hypothetical protein
MLKKPQRAQVKGKALDEPEPNSSGTSGTSRRWLEKSSSRRKLKKIA